jgi:hypothetical protein
MRNQKYGAMVISFIVTFARSIGRSDEAVPTDSAARIRVKPVHFSDHII